MLILPLMILVSRYGWRRRQQLRCPFTLAIVAVVLLAPTFGMNGGNEQRTQTETASVWSLGQPERPGFSWSERTASFGAA